MSGLCVCVCVSVCCCCCSHCSHSSAGVSVRICGRGGSQHPLRPLRHRTHSHSPPGSATLSHSPPGLGQSLDNWPNPRTPFLAHKTRLSPTRFLARGELVMVVGVTSAPITGRAADLWLGSTPGSPGRARPGE